LIFITDIVQGSSGLCSTTVILALSIPGKRIKATITGGLVEDLLK
jgi:hypothetical protein